MNERTRSVVPGWQAAVGILGVSSVAGVAALTALPGVSKLIALGVLGLAVLAALGGLFVLDPNEAAVFQFFGNYAGTFREPGLWWRNPLLSMERLSTRARSMETTQVKVNDQDGNPIEIAGVLVWRVVDTAKASFEVDDVSDFVKMQTETALRSYAMTHPYDSNEEGKTSLRASTTSDELRKEIQARVEMAGVEILEARISHLAYAPEIAHAMLQRQQATAILAARTAIVNGAIGIVETALTKLQESAVVDLDPERKAAMVSNLLVVLCGDRAVQPVVNTGTLY